MRRLRNDRASVGALALALALALIGIGSTLARNSNSLEVLSLLRGESPALARIAKSGAESAYLTGVAQFASGEFDSAARSFEAATGRYGKVSTWYLIRSLGMSDNWQEALALVDMERAEQRAQFVEIFTAHEESLSTDEQQVILDEVAKYEDASAAYAQHLMRQGKNEAALEWLLSNPRYDQWQSAQLHAGMAMKYLRMWEEAERTLGALYRSAPMGLNALWYGQVLMGMGNTGEGLQIFQEGIEGVSDSIKARYLAVYSEALAENVDCPTAYMRLQRAAPVPFQQAFGSLYQEALANIDQRCEDQGQ